MITMDTDYFLWRYRTKFFTAVAPVKLFIKNFFFNFHLNFIFFVLLDTYYAIPIYTSKILLVSFLLSTVLFSSSFHFPIIFFIFSFHFLTFQTSNFPSNLLFYNFSQSMSYFTSIFVHILPDMISFV
jgi:hypothetical protein